MEPIEEKKERKILKWIAYFLWFSLFAGVIFSAITFAVIANGDLPSFEDLENPKYDLASLVYDTKGEIFGKYFIENREQITYDELSPSVLKALINTEDERYFDHAGIDALALFRVVFKTLLFQQESSGGGSTISQQLAKLLYKRASLRGKSSISKAVGLAKVKFKEWITAVKLERSYTKEEILMMYLNKFEFINGAHGIQAAAQVYFGKDQKYLRDEEASLLVGMLKNPAQFNPNRFPERAKQRRNVVLKKLQEEDHLTEEVFDSLSQQEIDMSEFKKMNFSDGVAPYFRAELTKWLRKLLDNDQYAKPDGSKYNIYTDGLKIHTTIDLKYQKHAEAAVNNHMKWNQERYWSRWGKMDPIKYDADSLQRAQRKQSIERTIRYSENYQSLFDRSFKKLNGELTSDDNGFLLEEPPLYLIFNSKGGENFDAIRSSTIRSKYQKLSSKKEWSKVKDTWKDFREAYDKAFKTKKTVTVFDYEEGTIQKEMTQEDSVKYQMRHLQAGSLAVDPRTGEIKAWVGGIDHNNFKYDHVNMRRQVGSTIKPFVYASAIAIQGISPCQEYEDIQYSITPGEANFDMDNEWSPANSNEDFSTNKYNLYQGLLYSKNSITVRIVKEMGNVEVIRELLNSVGISKDEVLSGGRKLIPRLPSISLGAVDLSVKEMTGAYTTFANNGIYTEPIFVEYIEDKNGKVIYTGTPKRKTALNPTYNAVMLDMLENNTGGRYGMGLKTPNGGKTGTTNDYADGWFMGVTPSLVVGTWVGGDEKWVRFTTLDDGQGFVMARPIFQDFIKRIESDDTIEDYDVSKSFPKPPSDYYAIVDCDKYKQLLPEEEREMTLQKKSEEDVFEEEELEEEFEEEEPPVEELEEEELEEEEPPQHRN